MSLLALDAVIAGAQTFAPPIRGIYFLLRAGEVIYCGQSENIMARIYQHAREKVFDAYTIFECATEDNLDQIEADHILHYLPCENVRMPAIAGFISESALLKLKAKKHRLDKLVTEGKLSAVHLGNNRFFYRAQASEILGMVLK